MNLKEKYNIDAGVTLTAHLMQWFVPGNNHSKNAGVTYDSRDLRTIAHQITSAKALGVQAFLVDWYGPASVNGDGDRAFLDLLALSEIFGEFRAGIVIDKGAVKAVMAANAGMTPTAAFKVCYDYVTKTYAPFKAFFEDYILEFGCGDIGVSFAGYTNLLHDNAKYGKFYTWVGNPLGAPEITPHFSDPNCIMASVAFKFDDHNPADPTHNWWGTAARYMNSGGTVDNWEACWRAIPPTMRYVQLVTWNDNEERTGIEGALALA